MSHRCRDRLCKNAAHENTQGRNSHRRMKMPPNEIHKGRRKCSRPKFIKRLSFRPTGGTCFSDHLETNQPEADSCGAGAPPATVALGVVLEVAPAPPPTPCR